MEQPSSTQSPDARGAGHLTTVPLGWLAILVLGGAGAGWLVLELTGSVVAMGVVAAIISCGGLPIARRVRAARGRGPRFAELPSGDLEDASLGRQLGNRLAAVVALLATFFATYGLLAWAGLDGPTVSGALDASEVLALIVAFPAWFETDVRMGMRALRARLETEGRLHATATQPPSRPARVATEVPMARARTWLGALGLIAAGVGLSSIGISDGLDALGPIAAAVTGVASVAFGAHLVRLAVVTPYFVRLSADGIDLMQGGEIPWRAIASIGIFAGYGQRWLVVGLDLEADTAHPGWYTRRLRRMANRFGGLAPAASLFFAGASDGAVIEAVRTYADVEINVDLG